MSLSKDELELIGKKLEFTPDYIRFRSVCKSWRFAAPKCPQIPWLIRYKQIYSDISFKHFTFYQLSLKTNKVTPIPELLDWPIISTSIHKNQTTICIGSSRGWLVLFNLWSSCVLLFNPLTNSTIDLPNLENWMDNTFTPQIHSNQSIIYLTSDPGESLKDCFVVIYCAKRILYCKVGCGDWIQVYHPEFEYFKNVNFCYYKGKLLIASVGDVFLCDFGWLGWNPSIYKIFSVYSNNTRIRNVLLRNVESFLVDSNGDLLLVLANQTHSAYLDEFKVFKVEFGWKLVMLMELKSLGDKALFLSQRNTFILTASKYPGCEENHIYSLYSGYDSEEGSIVQKLRIYNFKTTIFVKAEEKVGQDSSLNVCTWFSPSLLTGKN